MKRSCSAVPQRTERAVLRLAPEPGDQRAEQQLLGEAHARDRAAFRRRGIRPSPSRPVGAVGRIELVDADLGAMGVAGDVDQQIAEQPVDQPQRRRFRPAAADLRERDFEFVELVVARLVEARRLAGRADEQAREQIGQRRMALPVEHQALQQIGPAQERRIGRRWRRRPRHDCRRRCRCGGRRS